MTELLSPDPIDQAIADQVVETERKQSVFARYHFTDAERADLAMESAEAVKAHASLQDELKQIRSDYKSRMEAEQRTITDASRKLREGYEMRPFRCRLVLDFGAGLRRWLDVETGEEHKTEPLRSEDYERDLFEASTENGQRAEAGVEVQDEAGGHDE